MLYALFWFIVNTMNQTSLYMYIHKMLHKSIDARKKDDIKIVYNVAVDYDENVKKFNNINPDQWLTKSLVDKTLDLVEIAPKQIPDDKIYKHLITVSFNNVARDLEGKLELNTYELRELFYKDGFDLNEKHYVRYKRSSGSSREGKCLFIEERLSKKMIPWSKCGLKAEDNFKKEIERAKIETDFYRENDGKYSIPVSILFK